MWYGFRRQAFMAGLRIFFVLGVLAVLAALVSGWVEETEAPNYAVLPVLLLAIPGIWLLFSLLFAATWLKIEGDCAEWYLFRRLRLKRVPIAEIVSIGAGAFSAVLLHTSRGTVRLIGLSLEDRAGLVIELQARNPSIRLE